MKILFVHEVNYQAKVIFEMHEFPELLALRGHSVSFLHYPESPDTLRRSLRTRIETIPGRVHPDARIRLITPSTFGGSSLERYAAPLLAVPAIWSAIRRGRFDAVVLYSVPTTGWQTTWLAKRHGTPVMFRALDVSHQIRETPVTGLIRAAERYVYKNVTLLSGNTPAMAGYCVEESGRTGPTVVNVPPIDLSHFAVAESDLRERYGIARSDRVVLYMGSFFPFSGLDTLVETMADELRARSDLRLVLVGGGEIDARLRDLVDRAGLDGQVIFTGVVPYAELPKYLGIADVAVNPFVPQLVTNVALPHKILQYMATGVPVVSTSLEGIRGVLGENSGVTWVPSPGDVGAAAIALAYSDAAQRTQIAVRQRATVLSRFSQDTSVDAFEEAIASMR